MSRKHESAGGHVSGRAVYTDEQHPPAGLLSLWPVQAPHAHARILSVDATAALAMPGVVRVLTAHDIPGENDTGPILHDEPLIAGERVQFYGQPVAWVVAADEAQARAAANLVKVNYEALPALLTLEQAIAAQSFHLPPAQVSRGDALTALELAPRRVCGEVSIGGQDHFYLETQASWVQIDAEGLVQIVASTQHPTETQIIVARVLGIAANRVVCRCLRMGGGFGGKETQANPFAAIAALAAWHTQQPVRIKLSRQLDMQLTGKRHPFLARYEVGFDSNGLLQALSVKIYADGGWSADLSPPVLMRAMVHIDNAYFCPNVHIVGLIGKTHLASNTAFRGFGGPQGMLVGEEILARIAAELNLPADEVRERNFYRTDGDGSCNFTPYGQPVVDNHLAELWQQLKASSEFDARRQAVARHNAAHAHSKRGIAITPVKFGISFNKTEYNQAGALVHIYTDGSIQLNHGGTEMGQGLHTKMLAVASRVLGVDVARIRVMATSTDKVPNTSATAASSGSDLNGQAVKAACETLLARLRPVAASMLGGAAEQVCFTDDAVFLHGGGRRLAFGDVVHAAYNARISLSATGYYRTPGLSWDPKQGRGHPFYYYAYGAAVAEVEVCGFSGVHQLRRVDLLHDVGESLAEDIDRGQVEGGFVQGLGWLTCEELRWNAAGRLLTDAPSTYKIPTLGEVPRDFRVALFRRSQEPSTDVIFGSKGVGEPPLMLALSVREALREAVAAFAAANVAVQLASPATPEAIFQAIEQARQSAVQPAAAALDLAD
ncbi:xanthine dehydrogenase molybdenum binding subunit apoprotein [Tahibacter aquaticus]|uniref:Xanthine dehydrogenase molybdenum binding subunit apoprotein n=1 Tax=Tahibacter aquaticus TaxID=520092 RepID=A0A4R6YMN2_9GAMM|nr:xanthine dehydrogenase molybdopterin binding subunit [Tahibacter aquaticus]TDR38724.1 xanthine dehydrogenase molybdenum binding subunit apoprotein [Tahibacter aquaticus]